MTTHPAEANEAIDRAHGICQRLIDEAMKRVDLAGADAWRVSMHSLEAARRALLDAWNHQTWSPLIMPCGCPFGSHPAKQNYLQGAAEREGTVCDLGWSNATASVRHGNPDPLEELESPEDDQAHEVDLAQRIVDQIGHERQVIESCHTCPFADDGTGTGSGLRDWSCHATLTPEGWATRIPDPIPPTPPAWCPLRESSRLIILRTEEAPVALAKRIAGRSGWHDIDQRLARAVIRTRNDLRIMARELSTAHAWLADLDLGAGLGVLDLSIAQVEALDSAEHEAAKVENERWRDIVRQRDELRESLRVMTQDRDCERVKANEFLTQLHDARKGLGSLSGPLIVNPQANELDRTDVSASARPLSLDVLVEDLYEASERRSLVGPSLDRLLAYVDHWLSADPTQVDRLFDRLDPSRIVRAVRQSLLATTHASGPYSLSGQRFLARFIADLRRHGTSEATIARFARLGTLPEERCPDCDRSLATRADFETHPETCPHCATLCWREYHDGCVAPRVDWRARALAAEADQ